MKKESANTCITLSQRLSTSTNISPTARTQHFTLLTRSLLTNLKHNQTVVRQSALQALGSIIRSSKEETLSESTLEALPIITSLINDRTPKIREILVQEVYSWLENLPLIAQQQSRLLLLLITSVADETSTVQQIAVDSLNKIGQILYDRSLQTEEKTTPVPMETETTNDSATTWLPSDISQPITSRPPYTARLLIQQHLKDLLTPALLELTDWTVRTRARAAGTLHILCIYAESHITVHLANILTTCSRTIRDEDTTVAQTIQNCVKVIGWFVTAEVWCEIIVPAILTNHDSNYRQSQLLLLLQLVQGTKGDDEFKQVTQSIINMAGNTEL